MVSLRSPALRHLNSVQVQPLRSTQRRWARVRDVRFVATQQNQERAFDKYKDKLDKKAKEKGYTNFNQLRNAYEGKIQEFKRKAVVPGVTAHFHDPGPSQPSKPATRPPARPPAPPKPAASSSTTSASAPPGVPTLSTFLDVEKALTLPAPEIEALWRHRHASNPQSLCAALPASTWSSIAANARAHPQFILPGLPPAPDHTPSAAPDGAVIHFLQWTFPAPHTATLLFTHLAEYKLRGEHAAPHTTLTHHLELAGEKGLVLAQGAVAEGRGVSVEEGRWLAMCMQKFYNVPSSGEEMAKVEEGVGKEMRRRRKRLMEMFSKGDEGFTVESLLEEAERLG